MSNLLHSENYKIKDFYVKMYFLCVQYISFIYQVLPHYTIKHVFHRFVYLIYCWSVGASEKTYLIFTSEYFFLNDLKCAIKHLAFH